MNFDTTRTNHQEDGHDTSEHSTYAQDTHEDRPRSAIWTSRDCKERDILKQRKTLMVRRRRLRRRPGEQHASGDTQAKRGQTASDKSGGLAKPAEQTSCSRCGSSQPVEALKAPPGRLPTKDATKRARRTLGRLVKLHSTAQRLTKK